MGLTCCGAGKSTIARWAKLMYEIDIEFSCFIGDHSSAIRSGFLAPPKLAVEKRVGSNVQAALAAAPEVYGVHLRIHMSTDLFHCFREVHKAHCTALHLALPSWHWRLLQMGLLK